MRTSTNDLSGRTIGLLSIGGKGDPQGARRRTTWTAHCTCGVTKDIREDALLSGRVRSCGCATSRFKKAIMEKRFSLVNKKFGRLWVVWREDSVKSGKSSHALWMCKCACGGTIKVTSGRLNSGEVGDCGCGIAKLDKAFGMLMNRITAEV